MYNIEKEYLAIESETDYDYEMTKEFFKYEDEYNLSYKDLKIFYLFCYNKVDYSFFKETLKNLYFDESYLEDKYNQFKKDPINFIISRDELSLFNAINNIIKETNYKG